MDIELLSKMVGELIIGHDQVGLPGVGTFVAEMVPASFSDKGFTINPPYRRLSFYPSRLEDTLLIDFYADSNHIGREAASLYITQYLAELKSVLEERKSVTLPGLGRLRATRENHLFFVADEGLDIFPAGVGLRPVSLKSHLLEEDPVRIDVPLPAKMPTETAEAAGGMPSGAEGPAETPATEEKAGGDAEAPAAEAVPQPQEEASPSGEELSRPQEEFSHPQEELSRPQEELPKPKRSSLPEWAWTTDREFCPEPPAPRRRFPIWILILLAAAAVFLGGFALLARLAPDFIDSILYSPDELWIIKY